MDHLVEEACLSQNQHGFVKNKSCMTNLLETLDDITRMLDDGFPVDEIFLDFKKAFDKVNHNGLLYKLNEMGIKDKTLMWIKSFITNRKQRVRVNGSYSLWAEVTSGVPQGSVLGPILFIAFINDLPGKINNNCKLFADDSKIYGKAESSHDRSTIQEDLNRCYDWSTK